GHRNLHSFPTRRSSDLKISLLAHREGRRQQGEVVEIIKRARLEFAGTLQHSGSYAFVVCDDSKMHTDVFVPGKNLNGARNGDKRSEEHTSELQSRENLV